jgi:glycerate dehydrogenase
MSTQPLKTVFLDYDTVSNGDLDLQPLREATGGLTLYESSATLIAERIHDADVALLNKLDLTRALLSGAPHLKLVVLAATGTNNPTCIRIFTPLPGWIVGKGRSRRGAVSHDP